MKVIWIPLLAAVAYAASILVAKISLTRRRISLRDYIPGIFFFLTLFSVVSLPKWGTANYTQLLGGSNLVLLLSIIVIAAVWNVLYYIGLSKEKVNTTEGIIILMPMMTIAISWFFSPQYFDARIALAVGATTFLVALAYRPRSLLKFDIYFLMLLASVIGMSLENVLVGQILKTDAISPAALYAVRTTLVFIIFYLYYRPSLRRLKFKTLWFLALSGIIGTTAMLLRFYGLRDAGITLTAVVLILVPVLVFSAAVLLLHEKITRRRLITMIAIGILILYATFANYSLLTDK